MFQAYYQHPFQPKYRAIEFEQTVGRPTHDWREAQAAILEDQKTLTAEQLTRIGYFIHEIGTDPGNRC